MCLCVVARDAHPLYRLVVAANRDEFHERPTAPAAWWPEGWLAGRDLRAQGTWFGVTRAGRFAFVTNVREPALNDVGAPSRGALVPHVLADPLSCAIALAGAEGGNAGYNGYNLVAGDTKGAWWWSNRHAGAGAPAPVALPSGISGVSNAALGTPWPKLVRTAARMRDWCASGTASLEPLFAALADRTRAADGELPATGVPLAWERLLSAPFIHSARYGTRASTVLTITHAGVAHFIEQAFDANGAATQRVDERFAITPSNAGAVSRTRDASSGVAGPLP
jgi:uncharacterized protein with NRDE domain